MVMFQSIFFIRLSHFKWNLFLIIFKIKNIKYCRTKIQKETPQKCPSINTNPQKIQKRHFLEILKTPKGMKLLFI